MRELKRKNTRRKENSERMPIVKIGFHFAQQPGSHVAAYNSLDTKIEAERGEGKKEEKRDND